VIWLLFAQPGLRSTEQGDTHKPADLELGTLVAQLHLAAIDIAVLRIEDLPAVIAITLFLKSVKFQQRYVNSHGMKLDRPKGPGKSKLDTFRQEIQALLANGSTQKFIARRY
jgi:hypothetical protein